jgi:tRNA-specific 2-thiouridylase
MAKKTKVLLAMSGGVDSSVAAALLLREGYEVVGCFMRLGTPGDPFDELIRAEGEVCGADGGRARHRGCCSLNDAADARAVAARFGIPFYVCNFKREFGRIIDYFVDEYEAGRTPNPCVRCNDWLKFGRLHEYARQIDADFVASGHYARIERSESGSRLLRGLDESKDQSYVLFGTPRDRLDRMLLPVGAYRKDEIRSLAREMDLPVFDKPDSQEICFVPDGDYAGLIERRRPGALRPGPVVDDAGDVVGEHGGHQHFTIGQRRGLGLAFGRPVYVTGKDSETNTVRIGPRKALSAVGCDACEANWLFEPPREWTSCEAQIRSHARPVAARVRATTPGHMEVRFREPQNAVAPGQAVVCYDGAVVLGGGWISEAVTSVVNS